MSGKEQQQDRKHLQFKIKLDRLLKQRRRTPSPTDKFNFGAVSQTLAEVLPGLGDPCKTSRQLNNGKSCALCSLYIKGRQSAAGLLSALGFATRLGLMLGFGLSPVLASEGVKTLRLGSYATERPSEELRKLQPFQKQLETVLKEQGQQVKIEVRIFPTYDEGISAITNGEIDIARLGPVSYVMAKQKNPAISLLVSESHEGDKEFPAVIVVTKNSPIKTIADLRGKRFAFGDPNSTSGRYLPQAELVKAGITAKDLTAYEYLGRHDKVVFAVASGGFDAGGTNVNTFRKYAAEKNLRELARYPSPTQAWVARQKMPPEMVKALRAALLGMKGENLEFIDRNGLLEAYDSDYNELRRIMHTAKGFGG